jgi:hypothetical protein
VHDPWVIVDVLQLKVYELEAENRQLRSRRRWRTGRASFVGTVLVGGGLIGLILIWLQPAERLHRAWVDHLVGESAITKTAWR